MATARVPFPTLASKAPSSIRRLACRCQFSTAPHDTQLPVHSFVPIIVAISTEEDILICISLHAYRRSRAISRPRELGFRWEKKKNLKESISYVLILSQSSYTSKRASELRMQKKGEKGHLMEPPTHTSFSQDLPVVSLSYLRSSGRIIKTHRMESRKVSRWTQNVLQKQWSHFYAFKPTVSGLWKLRNILNWHRRASTRSPRCPSLSCLYLGWRTIDIIVNNGSLPRCHTLMVNLCV